MANIMPTLIAAFVFVIIALVLLGIGLLITGKPGFQLRRCGRDPTKKRDKDAGCDTGSACTLCGKTEDEKETESKQDKK